MLRENDSDSGRRKNRGRKRAWRRGSRFPLTCRRQAGRPGGGRQTGDAATDRSPVRRPDSGGERRGRHPCDTPLPAPGGRGRRRGGATHRAAGRAAAGRTGRRAGGPAGRRGRPSRSGCSRRLPGCCSAPAASACAPRRPRSPPGPAGAPVAKARDALDDRALRSALLPQCLLDCARRASRRRCFAVGARETRCYVMSPSLRPTPTSSVTGLSSKSMSGVPEGE